MCDRMGLDGGRSRVLSPMQGEALGQGSSGGNRISMTTLSGAATRTIPCARLLTALRSVSHGAPYGNAAPPSEIVPRTSV
jgi:hypothetical protein